MTEQQLAEIEARAKAATPGPWRVEVTALRPRVDGEDVVAGEERLIASLDHSDPPDPNAAFIAAARSDVPALLEEVRHLRKWISEHWINETYEEGTCTDCSAEVRYHAAGTAVPTAKHSPGCFVAALLTEK